jgi:hypothetical protein
MFNYLFSFNLFINLTIKTLKNTNGTMSTKKGKHGEKETIP